MSGDSKDYKFGQKNNWRRTIWNEVLRRTGGREQHEPVLYLAGPDDYDRLIATSKGVPDRNLIAIDRCNANTKKIRGDGHAAIHGDVFDVIRAWPKQRAVSAIFLDFCGGLMSPDRMGTLHLMLMGLQPFQNAVVVVNLLRGRDPESNELRAKLADRDLALAIASTPAYANPAVLSTRHRAFIFTFGYAVLILQSFMGFDLAEINRRYARDPNHFGPQLCDILSNLRPIFYSYRSGQLKYDSVVMNPCSSAAQPYPGEPCDAFDTNLRDAIQVDPKTRRHLSAVLAVRTRRLEEEA